MEFDVELAPSADEDLDYYQVREQRVILDAIEEFLELDADVQTKKRKRLRPNPLAPWELRIGNHRVFYEVGPGRVVRVLAIGHKRHNDLFVRGRRVEP
jgi:mRNA-degrading endonuclease RelE of RelBE toxin-antitoxin system